MAVARQPLAAGDLLESEMSPPFITHHDANVWRRPREVDVVADTVTFLCGRELRAVKHSV